MLFPLSKHYIHKLFNGLNYKFYLFPFLLMILLQNHTFTQESDNILIDDIANNISNYKKKSLTLKLKLKGVDNIFEKITFYDRKNSEIEFDFSTKMIKGRLEQDLLNLHEGMDYRVTFIVHDIGNLGWLIGEILGFKPVILEKMP